MAEHCSADRYFLFVTFLVVAENYCLSTFKRRKVPSLSIPCCHLLTEGMFYCTCPPDTFDHPHAHKKNPFWNRHPLLNLISESTSRSTSTAEAVNTEAGILWSAAACKKFQANPSKSCGDIFVWTKAVDWHPRGGAASVLKIRTVFFSPFTTLQLLFSRWYHARVGFISLTVWHSNKWSSASSAK